MAPSGRRWRKPLAGTLLTVSLGAAACGGSGDASMSSEGGVTSMEITVTHYPTLLYAVPYIVAMEQGFFADEGIEITGISGSEGGGTTVRNVLTGDLPFGEVATPAAANAYNAGSPVVAVGGGVQSVAEINFVATKDSNLESIEDVAGTTVAFTSPGSVTQGSLALSLDAAGVDPANVNAKALGGIGEGLTALDGDAVDAAANLEPVYSGDPDPYKVLWWTNEYVPNFQQTVVITGPDMVEQNPDLVRSFLRARANAVDWVNENPQGAAELWAAEADLDPQVATEALRTVLDDDYYGVGFHADGLSAVDREMTLIDLVEEGTEIAWDELISQEFLPDGIEEIDPAVIGNE